MTTAFTANPMKITTSTKRFFLGAGISVPSGFVKNAVAPVYNEYAGASITGKVFYGS